MRCTLCRASTMMTTSAASRPSSGTNANCKDASFAKLQCIMDHHWFAGLAWKMHGRITVSLWMCVGNAQCTHTRIWYGNLIKGRCLRTPLYCLRSIIIIWTRCVCCVHCLAQYEHWTMAGAAVDRFVYHIDELISSDNRDEMCNAHTTHTTTGFVMSQCVKGQLSDAMNTNRSSNSPKTWKIKPSKKRKWEERNTENSSRHIFFFLFFASRLHDFCVVVVAMVRVLFFMCARR